MADTRLRIQVGVSGTAEVAAGLQSIQAAASRLKGGLLTIGAALAGAAGLGALGQAAINTAKLGGELSDLSARTGISARALITLRQAFKDAGLGADSVGSSINKLQRTIVEAASSGGAAADALAGIGLSAQSLASLAPEDQFSQVAAAISAIQSPAERSAAAMQIFGKSGAELLPLFAEGGAIQNAERVLGRMPEILARNVPTLDAISDSFDRLPNKATQLFAGILDQLGPTVQEMLDVFESIDLTAAGQNIGAFFKVAIDEFKKGNFSEFIGDVIEAGFEIGIKAGSDMFKKLGEFLGGSSFWAVIGNGLVTAINSAMKAVTALILKLAIPFGAISDYLKDALGYAFQFVTNKFFETLYAGINKATSILNKALGTSFEPITFGGETGFAAPDISRSWDLAKQGSDAAIEFTNSFWDNATNSFRQLTETSPFDIGSGALDRLNAKFEEAKRLRDEAAKTGVKGFVSSGEDQNLQPINTKLRLQELELGFNQRLQSVQQERSRIEASWLMTSNQKFAERKRLLEEEAKLIDEQIKALRELQAIAPPTEQVGIQQKLVQLQGRAGAVGTDMVGLGPDPESFSENFAATLVNLQNQFGTVAQQMAQTFADVFNAATASISNSIQGLIYGTMTWGAALANIGTSIIKSIIQSFADMLAQWIMTHVLMKGVLTAWSAVKAAFVAKDVAVSNAGEAAKTPALVANATWASISSWGIAVGVGLAAIAAVLAATGAFKEGGYTGDGNPNDFAGIVHRGEYVVPADAVDRIGVGTLEAITSGESVSAPLATPGAAASPITLNMGVFDDPRRLSDWARSNEGRTVLVDILRQHAHEFSS